jgi:hypothetical protein
MIYLKHRKARKANNKPSLTVNTNGRTPFNNDIKESTRINTPNLSAIERNKNTYFGSNLTGTLTLTPHNIVNVNQYSDSFKHSFTPIFDSCIEHAETINKELTTKSNVSKWKFKLF